MNEGLKRVTSAPAERAGAAIYDAVIVGAGMAGPSAALILGRSRRRVLVLDGGAPWNAPAAGAFLNHALCAEDAAAAMSAAESGDAGSEAA